MSRKRMRDGFTLTLLNIFFIVLCVLTMIPIMYALSVSLNGQVGLLSSDFSFIPKEFTLDNYKEVLLGEAIITWVKNTVILAAVTIALSLTIAIPAAYFKGSSASKLFSGNFVHVCNISLVTSYGLSKSQNWFDIGIYRNYGGI